MGAGASFFPPPHPIGPTPPQYCRMRELPEVAQVEMAVVGLLRPLGQLLITYEKCADLSWACKAPIVCSQLHCHYLSQSTIPSC